MIGVVVMKQYVVVARNGGIVTHKRWLDASGYVMKKSESIRRDCIIYNLRLAESLADIFNGSVYEYKGETNIMELKDLKANLTLEGIEEMIDKLNELKVLLVEANKLLSDIGSSQIDVDITVN